MATGMVTGWPTTAAMLVGVNTPGTKVPDCTQLMALVCGPVSMHELSACASPAPRPNAANTVRWILNLVFMIVFLFWEAMRKSP